jgi:hypothetical protein
MARAAYGILFGYPPSPIEFAQNLQSRGFKSGLWGWKAEKVL